ncbi:hypothetical protein GCM10018954_037580 [Kutzneria kofuensis]
MSVASTNEYPLTLLESPSPTGWASAIEDTVGAIDMPVMSSIPAIGGSAVVGPLHAATVTTVPSSAATTQARRERV